MTAAMIRLGTLLFKWRNRVFPLILVAAYALVPPSITFLGRAEWLDAKNVVALLVVAAGLGLRAAVIGYRYIKRGGLNKKVYADTLVTAGFFGIGRNPLYVGNMLIYFGIFLFHGDMAVIVAGTLLFLFIYQCIILTEEQFLANKFGTEYTAYCRETPRWGLRWSRLRESTAGMRFDLRKALFTDYGTVASTITILIATAAWRHLADPTQPTNLVGLWPLLVLALATGAASLAIRAYKHSPAWKAARG